MATADSVKTKLQGLVNTANTATGGSDATLTAAVDTLISGYGQGGGDSSPADPIISRTVTELSSDVETIGDYAFAYCKSLVSADFPQATRIGIFSFQWASALKSLNLPNVTFIDNNAIQRTGLTELVLPKVTAIGGAVFNFSASLVALVLPSNTMCTMSNTSFVGTPVASGTGYIYVPDDLVDTYKAATNWSVYADQIKPLSEYTEVTE